MPRHASRLSMVALLMTLCTHAHPQPTLVASSEQILSRPHDIVLSAQGDVLYVADNGNDRIVVLDAMSLRMLGAFAQGEVREPHDVVFAPSGELLVADTGNSRIAVFSVAGASGTLVRSFGKRLRRPEGVAVLSDGTVLATGAASGNVVVYNDGKVAHELGGFSSPHDIEVSPNGTVWLADTGNDRLVALSDTFTVLKTLQGEPYAFNGPRYLDFDTSGTLYVADKYANQIKVIGVNGGLQATIGTLEAGFGEGLFDRPEGVELRGGDAWFSDTYNDRIVRYKLKHGE